MQSTSPMAFMSVIVMPLDICLRTVELLTSQLDGLAEIVHPYRSPICVARRQLNEMLEGSIHEGALASMYFRFGATQTNVDMARGTIQCLDAQLWTISRPISDCQFGWRLQRQNDFCHGESQ